MMHGKNIAAIISALILLFAAAGTASAQSVVFKHKINSGYNHSMSLSKLEGWSKLLPKKLKHEIGDIYYPALRDGLQESDSMVFLEADVHKTDNADGSMDIDLSFPKFNLVLKDVTWEDLERLFKTYFV